MPGALIGSRDSLPNAVFRALFIGQGEVEARWLNQARAILGGSGDSGLRLVEVERAPDVMLIAGSPEWAERLIRQLRRAGDSAPMLVISVAADAGSKARVLDAGADDCLTCPFDPGELRARLRAVMRREKPSLRCSDIAVERASRRIRVRDVEAIVSPRQFEVFVCLAERRESWVHSNEIIAAVTGTHHDPTTSLVRVQIHALRKALGARRDCIRCDGRRSYMLTLASGFIITENDAAITRGRRANMTLK